MDSRNRGRSWDTRRRFMFAVSAFCVWTIGYSLIKQIDTKVAESAVTMAFLTLGGIVGSYVFTASWEDVSMAKLVRRKMNKTVEDQVEGSSQDDRK